MARVERRKPFSCRRKDGLLRFARNNSFSQNGEDGILMHVFSKIFKPLPYDLKEKDCDNSRWIVEIGSWDGKHLSNSHALLNHVPRDGDQNDAAATDVKTQKGLLSCVIGDWNGVLIEADKDRSEAARQMYAEKKATKQTVVCLTESVGLQDDVNTLDALLERNVKQLPSTGDGISGFCVLSIDVDGYDYWIWDSLQLYTPALVIIEFNPTIPNHIVFVQEKSESVRQGSSLAGLIDLAESKGYQLMETTLYNAFFIRSDLWEYVKHDLPDEGKAVSIDELHEPSMTTDLWQLYDVDYLSFVLFFCVSHYCPRVTYALRGAKSFFGTELQWI
eukprot:m.58097 g.58097  ORF g.58097 m.58097 type:complete len:332 (-) comp11155_c0_seq2:277-1272(-)